MFPIFADSFLTASRLDKPGLSPDYRLLHPDHKSKSTGAISKLWYYLS